ncbi:expressed unknown protein [Seminavis robusta]|uniref:Uncharacterized protein n=1 Tax=Seminavis robusta TaxID=568900 RepID=A0A9N8EPL8_9STRA|nr:expressed unknown protein [Seminavis robusta]|eukprot:Sro1542_g281080.1 n/a (1223) ;mRNA; f:20257-23993
MSMLRSAALTLLSKTLLTFLYKYLSDVDVDGVEMPSLYSTDGHASGWGVRLSNVKLREGAELMILPGTKRKPKPKDANANNENNNGTTTDAVISKDAAEDATETENAEHDKNEAELITPLHCNGNRNMVSIEEKDKELLMKKYGIANAPSTEDLDADLDELVDELDRSIASMDVESITRPDTPVQDSSIGFLSCFAHSEADIKKPKVEEQREQDANLSSETPSQEEREDEQTRPLLSQHANNHHQESDTQMNGHHHHHHSENYVLDMEKEADAVKQGIDDQLPELASEDDSDEGETDSPPPSTEDENDNERSLPPMALCIGEGGYIGTLDVRLVGRELHVLVEDAFLALEAVRKDEEPASNEKGDGTQKATADAQTGETEKKQANAAPAAAPINIEELKTTGERVLASNPLQEYFPVSPIYSCATLCAKDEEDEQEEDIPTKDDSADVVVDVGIGLLSVTEGEDFLTPFNTDDAAQEGQQPPITPIKTQTSKSGSSPDNEYMERRIRTGKGADGGIWLNVLTPKREKSASWRPPPRTQQYQWARQEWLEATRHRVLQCSGLDIQARIFLGTKRELAEANSSWYSTEPDTYEGIDHTLYGFDHVAPGPTPNTLPPLNTAASHATTSRSSDEGDDQGLLRSQVYKTDRNGIQSSQMESCFFRVARGMTPARCKLEHLPCENCLRCWKQTGKIEEGNSNDFQILDSNTPMPGLALSVSLREPLELNVDRLSLDGLGLVISLFKKKEQENPETVDTAKEAEVEPDATEDNPPVAEVVVEQPEPSRGYFSSLFFGSTSNIDDTNEGSFFPRRRKSMPLPPAFPAYMKPEHVQILGVFVAEIRLRVHVMRADDGPGHNAGLSFMYWDAKLQGLTLDQQKLTADEHKNFQDLRLDCGLLSLDEFKGVQKQVLISAGIPPPSHDGGIATLAELTSINRGQRPPWPTTACALLDVPATVESMVYESRERHGIQLRLLEVCNQPKTDSESSRTLINCQLGALEINLPWPVAPVFAGIKTEVMQSLGLGKKAPTDAPQPVPEQMPKKDTATEYRAQLGGGRVRLGSMIDIRLPLTRLAGDICPESGFSVETLLDKVELSYGSSSKKLVPTAGSNRGVSMKRVPNLPEKVRLRVLLFLGGHDLDPLEEALGVKKQSNSFLRCNALNKALGKLAAKRGKKKTHEPKSNKIQKLNRRQELVNKILTLDDDALENLWSSHLRKQRKGKKANGAKKAG